MLALITCYFNPCGYEAPLANYWRFRQAVEPAPLVTVELSYNETFVIPGSMRVHGVRANQILWQKERLLNLAIERLPEKYDRVAWLDNDILFLDPDWYCVTEDALDRWPVVQMFSNCHWLDRFSRIEKSRPGSATIESYLGAGSDKSHPGFAWAARREDIARWGGLFDQDVTGSGDAWMTHGFFREYDTPMTQQASPGLRRAALAWCERFQRSGGTVGHVVGDLLHLYHGSYQSRGYWERFLIQRDHKFDPATDIKTAPNGAWMWATPKPGLHTAVAANFAGRKEDS
ncbi:hypothetical protein [Rubinisphaera italica]|uniref:Glycosyl transferase family 8 n=1 Tax=Rubinisphaera italica TaxID=2527969 RepID=A0A5C5XM32_9PLAN|nr:hypothetical protein [Rubinisphaera italica]TWT63175.1 hypothetical protein Pan54_39280 [Rubinisphaera italica]